MSCSSSNCYHSSRFEVSSFLVAHDGSQGVGFEVVSTCRSGGAASRVVRMYRHQAKTYNPSKRSTQSQASQNKLETPSVCAAAMATGAARRNRTAPFQRLQNSSIKEYTLNHTRVPAIIQGIFLTQGVLQSPGFCVAPELRPALAFWALADRFYTASGFYLDWGVYGPKGSLTALWARSALRKKLMRVSGSFHI